MKLIKFKKSLYASFFKTCLITLACVAFSPMALAKDAQTKKAKHSSTQTLHAPQKGNKKVTENKTSTIVKFDIALTSKTKASKSGIIKIELNTKQAPITSANFIKYVQAKFYDGSIFHRVIPGFMIQGGGFDSQNRPKELKGEKAIENEAKNGLKNDRGTIAMARTSDPNSARSQFFINLVNNDGLNYSGAHNPGYAVFGKVTEGLDIIDEIAKVKTAPHQEHYDWPMEAIVINSATVE